MSGFEISNIFEREHSDSFFSSRIDLSHHLNDVAGRRKPSPLKEMAKYMSVPGMTSLAGGMPLYFDPSSYSTC